MADRDNRVSIHPCPFDTRPCDNYQCRRSFGSKKYWVSNPYGSVHDTVFCEDCVKHLVAHIPAELIEGAADLEQRLREEITAELEAKHALNLEGAEQRITDRVRAELAVEFAQQETITQAVEEEMPEEEEELDEGKPVYRCLECPEEFDTAQKLSVHRRIHDAPPASQKTKGGSRPGARKRT